MVERKSRLLKACKVATKEANEVARGIVDSLLDLPASRLKTVTFDYGTELARNAPFAPIATRPERSAHNSRPSLPSFWC